MTQPTQGDEPVKELIKQHWNGRAATYGDKSHHGIHSDTQLNRWLIRLREWTGDDPLHVLDIGCGTGVISLLLADLGHDVMGVDFAPEMVERAKTNAERTGWSVEFHCGDAEALAVPDDAFELVTARHLLWTLPRPVAALREWQRIVEPGGQILLMEGYGMHSEPWDEYKEVSTELPMYDGQSPEEMRDLLEQEGFDGIEYEPLMDPVLWGREPPHEYYLMVGRVPR